MSDKVIHIPYCPENKEHGEIQFMFSMPNQEVVNGFCVVCGEENTYFIEENPSYIVFRKLENIDTNFMYSFVT